MKITLIEVGLRDGLQSEAVIIPTATKIQWVQQLIAAGLRQIQVCSFVHPQRVPQMADAEAVCTAVLAAVAPDFIQREGLLFSGLVLNLKGVERAASVQLPCVDMGVSASNTHSLKNMGKDTEAALIEMTHMVNLAREHHMRVRAAVQCAFGCVYEGAIALARVVQLVEQYLALGVAEIALADSTGMAHPAQIRQMLHAVQPLVGAIPLTLHLHDTRGMGLANVYAALEDGVTHFDTAFGGLGGCPFIRGATGNIATEDTAYMLEQMGMATGIAIPEVARVSQQAETLLGHSLASKLYPLVKSS
jgi:hydroxymethylglutaryl-CoA lyase